MQDGGETQRAHRAGRSAETSLRRMLGRGPLGNAGWFWRRCAGPGAGRAAHGVLPPALRAPSLGGGRAGRRPLGLSKSVCSHGLFLRRMPRARRKASPRPLRPLCVWLCVAKMRDRDETGTHSVHDLWPERVHPMQGNLPRNPKESERRMVKQPQSSHWAGDKVWPHPASAKVNGFM